MSAGGAGAAKSAIPANTVITIGIVGGLAGIYLTLLNQAFDSTLFSFFGGIGAIIAAYWGADAVRRVCSYGLGTGVPSIGMLALGMGIIAAIFGLSLAEPTVLKLPIVLGPLISFIVAGIIGLIIGILANKVLKMNIPIMEKSMVEIAGSGALVMIGLSTAIAGSFSFNAAIMPYVVGTGYIALVFIGGAMIILHPFNANLGPDEKQYRTLSVAIEKGAMIMVLAGVASLTVIDAVSAGLTIIIGLILWVTYFKRFINAVHADAHLVTGTGLLPTEEELQ